MHNLKIYEYKKGVIISTKKKKRNLGICIRLICNCLCHLLKKIGDCVQLIKFWAYVRKARNSLIKRLYCSERPRPKMFSSDRSYQKLFWALAYAAFSLIMTILLQSVMLCSWNSSAECWHRGNRVKKIKLKKKVFFLKRWNYNCLRQPCN